MKRVVTTILLSLLLLFAAKAQKNWGNWYIGIKSGVNWGFSTFSSFGGDKFRGGWNAGLLAGYRFSGLWSAEFSASVGSIGMDSQECCAAYYLGSDGMLYFAPVSGMDTYPYPAVYSKINTQQYSAQFNFDLFDLLGSQSERRWSLDVSPVLSALVSKASLRLNKGDATVIQRSSQWNIGLGGELSAGYRLSNQLKASLYSGVTYLPGARIDGMPKRLHRNNCIWQSGLKLTWCPATKKSHQVISLPSENVQIPPAAPIIREKIQLPQDVNKKMVVADSITIDSVVVKADIEKADIAFPTIYFSFNSTRIEPTQIKRAMEVLSILNQHPELRIEVDGWCDRKGTKAINLRISLQRAEALKKWLVEKGIKASRITTRGNGSDDITPEAPKARRVHVKGGKL